MENVAQQIHSISFVARMEITITIHTRQN